MKNTMKMILFSAFFSFVVIPFVSCSKSNADKNSNYEEDQTIQAVRAEKLVQSDLRKFIELNGNIRAEKSLNVYPSKAGKIAGSPVHLGSKVKKGDAITYVDPSLPGSHYSLHEVDSPINGTVISIPLKEGTHVTTETAVAIIGDLSNLQIITYIPERYVSYLKNGLDADLMLEAYPAETFRAVISEVSPVLDEATRTKEIILSFIQNDSRINAGMFADIKLYLKNFQNVFSVPTSCIIENGGKKFVYIISDTEKNSGTNIARLTEISTGEEIATRTIVTFSTELPESAMVVTHGFETLQDGTPVNIAE